MADLVVIVPSRGRPEAADELTRTFLRTCTRATELWFAVDSDDPELTGYVSVSQSRLYPVSVISGETHTMVEALNKAASFLADDGFAIGFMGDDHRPRTAGWDARYLEVLRELGTGIVYGNDLLQGERLPTQCAMTADIVRTLGWMAPPVLRHMYVDNFWRDLGGLAGCLRYLPDVVVEHMHPVAGKAPVDDGYVRVNAPAVYATDERAYRLYAAESLAADVERVRALRQVPA